MKLTYSLDEIDSVVVPRLLELQERFTIFALTGPLGVGKTTLIMKWLAANGVQQEIVSPTFTYVQMYRAGDWHVCHFDLYRLEHAHEFIQRGFDEYLGAPQTLCVIEWPGVIESLLSDEQVEPLVCNVEIEYLEQRPDARQIVLE